MISCNLADRIRGCVLVGAIGDAMGGPLEGRPGPVEYQDHQRWAISDDTQLTLATCEAVVEAGGASPESIADTFVRWFQARRLTGIGASTLKALRDLQFGQHWALAGARGEMAAGNGAAMRVAPLAFLLDPAMPEHRRTLRDICRITHHHEEAYIGGLAVVCAVRGVSFHGVPPTDLLSYVIEALPDSRVRDRIQEIAALPGRPSVLSVGIRLGCSGYVVDSVPLALYAAQRIDASPLFDVLCEAIAPGGDADTVASMIGQIAGAACGDSAIPKDLLEKLPQTEMITTILDRFVRVAELR